MPRESLVNRCSHWGMRGIPNTKVEFSSEACSSQQKAATRSKVSVRACLSRKAVSYPRLTKDCLSASLGGLSTSLCTCGGCALGGLGCCLPVVVAWMEPVAGHEAERSILKPGMNRVHKMPMFCGEAEFS